MLLITIRPSTPQKNAADCGVYAVALLRGDVDGLQAPFDVHAMRGQLERCLEAGKLPFPHLRRRPTPTCLLYTSDAADE